MIASATTQNVRFWHIADIRCGANAMSAFGGKADIASTDIDVRY